MTTDPCPDFVPLVVHAADDSLSDATERARLDRHLATCAACRMALGSQRESRAWLTGRLPVQASPALRARVRLAIDQEQETFAVAGIDFRRWTWRLVPIAAACALAAVWGVARTGVGTEPADSPSLPVSAALFSEEASDTSILSLMLRASADDALADYWKETSR
jgi:anti-sigma factor RsiW